jgi:hypothetical protein
VSLCGISASFEALSRTEGPISYVFLTRAPLSRRIVRLACVRHAANVHPEPGSNSPFDFDKFALVGLIRSFSRSYPRSFHLTILLLSCVHALALSARGWYLSAYQSASSPSTASAHSQKLVWDTWDKPAHLSVFLRDKNSPVLAVLLGFCLLTCFFAAGFR